MVLSCGGQNIQIHAFSHSIQLPSGLSSACFLRPGKREEVAVEEADLREDSVEAVVVAKPNLDLILLKEQLSVTFLLTRNILYCIVCYINLLYLD
jgi:hypothetical protein